LPQSTTLTRTRTAYPTAHRKTVAVCPADALDARPRLFEALSAALPISFERGDGGKASAADAAIIFSSSGAIESRPPAGVPTLLLNADEPPHGGGEAVVEFGDGELLDRRLRRRRLVERCDVAPAPLTPRRDDRVLASIAGAPVWTARTSTGNRTDVASCAPAELGPDKPLRSLLSPGRFMSLLPIVHFLRGIAGEARWEPPPLRATFLFDDPNLHWPSYGHLRYRELAAQARAHGYHAAIAMVPGDARVVHPEAARIFREHARWLSVIVHGNDHSHAELDRPRDGLEADKILAQALRRMDAFEAHSGLRAGRVMAPPHGVCSKLSLRTMLHLGFEAVCLSRSHPWLPATPADDVLAGWNPADLVAGGIPVMPRVPFGRPDEIVLRAFLDHPLVVYGHHQDLAGGLAVLASTAELIDSLDGVRWSSPHDIARSNFATRREASTLAVRMFSRRVTIDTGAGVETLRVEVPCAGLEQEQVLVRCGATVRPLRPADGHWASVEMPIEGAGTIEIMLTGEDRVDPYRVAAPRRAVWPHMRRTLAQGRDRLLPLVERARRRAVAEKPRI